MAWVSVRSRQESLSLEPRFYAHGGGAHHEIARILAADSGLTVDIPDVAGPAQGGRLPGRHHQRGRHRTGPGHRPRRPRQAPHGGGLRRSAPRRRAHSGPIGVLDWFGAIVTAEDTARHKPDPHLFLEAARRLGVAPEGCTVYEDADLGVEAARRAGMRCVDMRDLLAVRAEKA